MRDALITRKTYVGMTTPRRLRTPPSHEKKTPNKLLAEIKKET